MAGFGGEGRKCRQRVRSSGESERTSGVAAAGAFARGNFRSYKKSYRTPPFFLPSRIPVLLFYRRRRRPPPYHRLLPPPPPPPPQPSFPFWSRFVSFSRAPPSLFHPRGGGVAAVGAGSTFAESLEGTGLASGGTHPPSLVPAIPPSTSRDYLLSPDIIHL